MEDERYYGNSSTDPYFTPEYHEEKQHKKRIKKSTANGEEVSIFDSEESRIALIRILLSGIGKTIEDVDQEFIDSIFSEDHFIPKIFSEYAKKNCKKCFGRGFTHWVINPGYKDRIPVLCKCLKVAKK